MRVEIVTGDITKQAVDAIVNAANPSLLGGGGVDGAIHRAAGGRLDDECSRLRQTIYPDGLPTGQAVATSAGDLPIRWIIHTVGPNAAIGQTDPSLLAACFTNCLRIARGLGVGSLAFPAISAGVYGWSADDVAAVAAGEIGRQVAERLPGLVRFVLFTPVVTWAFQQAFSRAGIAYFNPGDGACRSGVTSPSA